MRKKIILRYGIYAGIAELAAFVLVWLIIDIGHLSYEVQGNLGYPAILCPLVFVYFGIRYYRDKLNNGAISFLKALQVGMLIMIVPAISYAIIETVYVIYIDPHFYENLAKYDLEQYRKVLSSAKFAIKQKQEMQQLATNNNLLINFFTMILIMTALGTIVSLISALLAFKRPKKVA
jgi:Protein of unknown function (DUF4199)